MERLNVMKLAWKIYKAINYKYNKFSNSLKLAWKICKQSSVFQDNSSIKIKSKILTKIKFLAFDTKRQRDNLSFKDTDRNLEIFSYEVNYNF